MSRCLPILAIVALASADPAAAVSFTANSSIDSPDNNPGDGLCRSDLLPASTCTLRAAIMEANALPGNHIINLQSGRTYTLTRTGVDNTALNGDLDITKSLIIWCLGCEQRPVLDVNGVSRGFHILGGDVTLANFDITGGNATSGSEDNGGAILIDEQAGTVVLSQMRLYGNQATRLGGALRNLGAATTVSASELFDNEITSLPTGTAISNWNQLTLLRTALYGNSGSGNGEADATISTRAVGGLPGRIELENVTVSENLGAGLVASDSESVRVRNSTIVGNSANGIRVFGSQSVTLSNSIIAKSGGASCHTGNNISYSSNNNIISDNFCAQLAGNGSLQGVNPLLTPLKLRSGGPIRTPLHWPRQDSAALSAGSLEPIGSAMGCLAVDQLGINRPQGYNGIERCDIGAAEVPDDAIFFDSMESM